MSGTNEIRGCVTITREEVAVARAQGDRAVSKMLDAKITLLRLSLEMLGAAEGFWVIAENTTAEAPSVRQTMRELYERVTDMR